MSRMPEIYAQISRACALHRDLLEECERCFLSQELTPTVGILTHEIYEKMANVLDQTFYLAWETRIKPRLPPEKHNPKGYFICADTEFAFRGSLKKWYMSDLEKDDPVFFAFIQQFQLYNDGMYDWIKIVRDVARHKHIRLMTQTFVREQRQRIQFPYIGDGAIREETPETRSKYMMFGDSYADRRMVAIREQGLPVKEVWTTIRIKGHNLNIEDHTAVFTHFLAALVKKFETELGLI